jgi:hypothetical protein
MLEEFISITIIIRNNHLVLIGVYCGDDVLCL